MAKHCYDVYVPVHDNDGNLFDSVTIADIRTEIIEVFGCLTLLPSITGYWKDPSGRVYIDDVVIYRIICPCSVANHVKISALQKHLAVQLRQKVIFILRYEVCIEEQPRDPAAVYNRGN